MFLREVELEGAGDGAMLELWQESVGDVGCVVWDAAIVLTKYLEYQTLQEQQLGKKETLLENHSVVELGAGTGCVGLAAAALGAKEVTITDLPEFVELMQKNIEHNKAILRCDVKAAELTWGQDNQIQPLVAPDVLIVADCLYYEGCLEPLVSTIDALCGPKSTVLFSFEERTSDNKVELQKRFFELMLKSFKNKKIPREDQHEEYRCDDIHLYKFWR